MLLGIDAAAFQRLMARVTHDIDRLALAGVRAVADVTRVLPAAIGRRTLLGQRYRCLRGCDLTVVFAAQQRQRDEAGNETGDQQEDGCYACEEAEAGHPRQKAAPNATRAMIRADFPFSHGAQVLTRLSMDGSSIGHMARLRNKRSHCSI